jgi:hypothetical protein
VTVSVGFVVYVIQGVAEGLRLVEYVGLCEPSVLYEFELDTELVLVKL